MHDQKKLSFYVSNCEESYNLKLMCMLQMDAVMGKRKENWGDENGNNRYDRPKIDHEALHSVAFFVFFTATAWTRIIATHFHRV